MSIIKINKDNFERYSLLTNPTRTFSSASNNVAGFMSVGITGTLPLFTDRSSAVKDVFSGLIHNSSASNDQQLENLRSAAVSAAATQQNFFGAVESYFTNVNSLPSSSMYDKKQSVIRFEPGVRFNPDFLRKRSVKEVLFPYYRSEYQSLQWSYTNYHSLNFVTCSYLPTASVLIYPAGTGTVALENTNFYAPSSSFTFDFYVNPRYTQENVGDEFRAGTILHMSSSYAISLVTGTEYGIDGKKSAFRLLLQLSQSAEIPPSSVSISGIRAQASGRSAADQRFLFVSPDNVLKHNTWHHVAIRWGGINTQNGTGSFVIDGEEVSTFAISSASVMAPIQTATDHWDADALFIGNFYEGSNYDTDPIAGFFNSTAAQEFGTLTFSTNVDRDPRDAKFNHPLNAEIHDLKIFNVYRSLGQIAETKQSGINFSSNFRRLGVSGSSPLLSGSSAADGLLFYLPPFFTKESPTRYVNQTPFFYAIGSTDDPFNVAMSFGVGGHELNLQNFTREFVRGFYPRPFGLEAARIDNTLSVAQTANYLIYESGSNRKRNISVLPCDNGKFYPNFQTLLTGSSATLSSGSAYDKFVNDFGGLDFSRISLNNMVSTASLSSINAVSDALSDTDVNSLLTPLLGASPENPGGYPGNILTILQRTKDPSSNEVVFFDVSNMFYGDQIKPKSVILKDLAVTGTNGRVQITLRDDGYGNLYRADARSTHATWASVGNVIYDEGIIVIKSPNIPMFGSDAWELTFEGQRNIHVLEINVPVEKGQINSSSNPSFQDLIPSDYPSETSNSFVYLTGLQLHDENLNVVGRANFAQPIVKRDGDRYTVRLRMDF